MLKPLTIFLAATALLGGACARRAPSDPVENLAARLPPETAGVVTLGHLDRLVPTVVAEMKHFHVDDKLALATEKLGFDATSLDAWAAAGFDPVRPIAIAYIGPLRGAAAVVPAKDAKALRATVLRLVAKAGVTARGAKIAGRDADVLARGSRDEAAFVVEGDTLVAAIAADGADPASTLARLLARPEGPTLAGDDNFKALRADRPADANLWLWLSPTVLALGAQQAKGQLDWMGDLKGLAFGLGTDGTSVRIRYGTGLAGTKLAAALPERAGGKFLERVAGAAWSVGRSDVVLDKTTRQAVLASPLGRLSVQGVQAQLLAKHLPISVENDLLPLLPDHVTMEWMQLATPQAKDARDAEWVGAFAVADAAKAAAMIARLGAPSVDGGGAKWTIVGKAAIAMLDGKLVIVGGPDPAALVQRAFAAAGPRAMASVPAAVQGALRDGPAGVFWAKLDLFGVLFGVPAGKLDGDFVGSIEHHGDAAAAEVVTSLAAVHQIVDVWPQVAKQVDPTPVRRDLDGMVDVIVARRQAGLELPPATAWTPAGSACDQPDRKYPLAPALWQAEPWKTLGFAVTTPSDVQYRVVRPDADHVYVEAQRDFACSGGKVRYRAGARVEGGRVLREPFAPTDSTLP